MANDETFIKNDSGKLQHSLLPIEALEETTRVLMFGAQKYAKHNWAKGCDWTRYSDATLRHLFAWIGGEDKDPETGLSHLAHALCCLMFLETLQQRNDGTDDRFKPITNTSCNV